MAIPLVFLVPAAISGVYGLVKGGNALKDRMSANKVNNDAEAMVNAARQHVERHRVATERVLEDYGARKLRAFNGVISDFIDSFSTLKNVEIADSPELEKLRVGESSKAILASLRNDYQVLQDAGLGLGAGLGGGAALAFGAYNGTMLLATASTGTAISSLSGAAATNATLAWLGGGALSAGGGGIAMGTMVLGGIVAGPALAIFGFIVGSKAEAALATAQGNLQQARTARANAETVATQLSAIRAVTELANKTFSRISSRLRFSTSSLNRLIESRGMDYGSYTEEERAVVLQAVKFAQLLKAMIDTPILDESGNLVLATRKRIRDVSEMAGIEVEGAMAADGDQDEPAEDEDGDDSGAPTAPAPMML